MDSRSQLAPFPLAFGGTTAGVLYRIVGEGASGCVGLLHYWVTWHAHWPGDSWQPAGHPAHVAHEYIRNGTAKLLTLFHPADGQVQVKGVTSATNDVLHTWLKEELTAILATITPAPLVAVPAVNRALWHMWCVEHITAERRKPTGAE